MNPREILVGPIEAWVAPVGEAFPSLDTVPAGGNWGLIGTSGAQNITEDGVTVRHSQEMEFDAFRMLSTTAPRKASRVSEDLIVEFVLADFSLEEYARALHAGTVTEVAAGAGTVGTKEIDLLRGLTVAEHALLLRGNISPYLAEGSGEVGGQYEISRVVQEAEVEAVFVKNAPVGLQFTYRALLADDGSFAVLRAKNAEAA